MKLSALFAAEDDDLTAVYVAQTTTASQATRTITGLVAPYNQYGMTSAGKVKFLPGSIRLPDDLSRVKLLEHHTNEGTPPESVGHAIAAHDTPDGLVMTFGIARTQKGDDALTSAQEKAKDSFSVELIQVDLHRDEVRSAALTAVAHVPIPAFAAAQVTSVAASHHEPSTTQEETMKMTDEQKARLGALRAQATLTQTDAAELVQLAALERAEEEAATEEAAAAAATGEAAAAAAAEEAAAAAAPGAVTPEPAAVAAAHAPATLTASTTSSSVSKMKARNLFATLSRIAQGERSPELTAALEDIAYTGSPFANQPEYVGELWNGAEYERRYVPLLDTSSPLTSLKVTGWRWVEEPDVDDWAGDKADVPSNEVSWSEHPFTASRLAGAHDIAREWFDFGDAAAIEAFFRVQAKNYKKKTDVKALAAILATATGSTAVVGNILKAAAVAAQQVEDNTDAKATAILVNPTDRLGLLDITSQEVSAFLRDILGIDPGNFKAAATVPSGTVIALNRRAIKFRELPGVPIRVNAENIAQGGRDSGLFGYWLAQPELPEGVRKVTFAPAGD